REKWEKQYAQAHARWEAHKIQVEEAIKADAEAAANPEKPTSYSSNGSQSSESSNAPSSSTSGSSSSAAAPAEGTLASDEALAALREKLTGN
ncbi:MAG: small subunit ribosomal protein, partial [Actinomycetota bacterium]|nr:small subunit ribosomal protein [Actinomycetota bacterium]